MAVHNHADDDRRQATFDFANASMMADPSGEKYRVPLTLLIIALSLALLLMTLSMLLPGPLERVTAFLCCRHGDEHFNYIDAALYKTRHSMYRKEVYSQQMRRSMHSSSATSESMASHQEKLTSAAAVSGVDGGEGKSATAVKFPGPSSSTGGKPTSYGNKFQDMDRQETISEEVHPLAEDGQNTERDWMIKLTDTPQHRTSLRESVSESDIVMWEVPAQLAVSSAQSPATTQLLQEDNDTEGSTFSL